MTRNGTRRLAAPSGGAPDSSRPWIATCRCGSGSRWRRARARRPDPRASRTPSSSVAIGGTSVPIAIGLLLMMYPVLARVRYEELGTAARRARPVRLLAGPQLVIGPLLMFTLAWLMLPDEPAYRTGLIVVGLARCIAMVLIWSELACADREATAVLVAINSLFQIVAYSPAGVVLPLGPAGLAGARHEGFSVGIWEVARTVLIFLGIPLAAGYLTRRRRPAPPRSRVVRRGPSSRGSARSRSTGCSSRSSCCSRSRATRSPASRSTWCGSRCRCSPTSWSMFAIAFALGHGIGLRLSAHRDPRPHRRLEQLRAGDRGGDRRLRRDLGRGAGRRRRSADRGAGPRRSRLRLALGARPLVRRDPRRRTRCGGAG